MIEFLLPDVGEGLTEAEVSAWLVQEGDTVAVNDPLVEVETAKSLVELPSPGAGRVAAIHVAAGATVPVGTALVSIEPTAGSADTPLVLVGSGPTAPAARRRRLTVRARPTGVQRPRAKASPPVRALAKRLGVDLDLIAVPAGVPVTRSDVERAAGSAGAGAPPGETRIPVRGVRRATAEAMVASAFTAPHVTEWLTVDVTPTMNLLARLRADPQWTGVRLTPLVLVARALMLAVARAPQVNARWDGDAGEIVVHDRVNLGIAAATPRGLLVPNIKDAGALDLRGLAEALTRLVDAARGGRATAGDLTGGTITITNIGAFGVDAGTPILNPGEAAILAVGAVNDRPWVVGDAVVPRKVVQLALSFDHRLVDGELGSRVLTDVGRLLSEPDLALAWA